MLSHDTGRARVALVQCAAELSNSLAVRRSIGAASRSTYNLQKEET
jgi:hypothetical protein